MRVPSVLLGVILLSFGLTLLTVLLYDATDLVTMLGLEPEGNEAILVVVGLALVAFALSSSVRHLRSARRVAL